MEAAYREVHAALLVLLPRFCRAAALLLSLPPRLTLAARPCSCLLVSLAASSCSISELLSDTAASRALRSSSRRLQAGRGQGALSVGGVSRRVYVYVCMCVCVCVVCGGYVLWRRVQSNHMHATKQRGSKPSAASYQHQHQHQHQQHPLTSPCPPSASAAQGWWPTPPPAP